jgi:hypothetical protein
MIEDNQLVLDRNNRLLEEVVKLSSGHKTRSPDPTSSAAFALAWVISLSKTYVVLTFVATVLPHQLRLIPLPPFEKAKIRVWIKPLMAIPTSKPASVR